MQYVRELLDKAKSQKDVTHTPFTYSLYARSTSQPVGSDLLSNGAVWTQWHDLTIRPRACIQLTIPACTIWCRADLDTMMICQTDSEIDMACASLIKQISFNPTQVKFHNATDNTPFYQSGFYLCVLNMAVLFLCPDNVVRSCSMLSACDLQWQDHLAF